MKTTIQILFLLFVCAIVTNIHINAMPMANEPAKPAPSMPTVTIPSPTPSTQPTTMPTAMPSATMPTTTQPLIPVPATQPTTNMPTATATPTDNAQQELSQLNQIIDTIKTAKKELKDQIKQLDEKLSETRTDITNMRKNSSEILTKAQEAEAQALLTTINTGLTKVTTTQAFVTGDFSRSFDNNISKIQNLIEQGHNLVKTIQAKSYQYQVTQTQLQALEEKTKETVAAKEAAAQEKLAAQKRQPGIWSGITFFFARAAHRIQNFFIGIKNIFTTESKDAKTIPNKTERSLDVKKKINETPQTLPSAPTSISPATRQLITTQLTTAENTLKQLEEQQKSIDQKLNTLDKNTTTFVEALKNVQQKDQASINAKAKAGDSQEPKWKQAILFVTSEVLDALAFVVTGIKFVLKTIYDYFFAGIVNRFVGDVKEKIKEEEAKGKKQQSKEARITEPAKQPEGQPRSASQTPPMPAPVPPAPTTADMAAPTAQSMPSEMPSAGTVPSIPTSSTQPPAPAAMGGMPMA